MGGCRCSFRNCTVSTNNSPGISFFHYPHPVKRKEKFEKWVKYSNKPEINKLQVAQIVNRVVCAQHFRDECFMNYMKKKLTQSAVPTLDPLPNGMVLDYEADDNPKPIKLKPSLLGHLRPPTEKTLSGDEDLISIDPEGSVFLLNVSKNSETCNNVNNSSYNIYIQNDSNDEVALSSDCLQEANEPEIKKVRLTEETTQSEAKSTIPKNPILGGKKRIKVRKAAAKLNYCGQSSRSNAIESRDETEFQNVNIIDQNVIDLPNSTIQSILSSHDLITEIHCVDKVTTFTENELNEILQSKQNEFETKLKELKEASIPKSEMKLLLNISTNDVNKKNDELNEKCCEYEKIKQELEILKKEYTNQINQQKNEIMKLKQNLKSKENAIKKSTLEGATIKPSPSSNGLVTKAQIFNSVKKYLSSSMSALVRMEMFAAPEREWKSDEKQCSVELMKLGKNVYNYFRDEWRCRLPSNKDVENWMNDISNSDEDENL